MIKLYISHYLHYIQSYHYTMYKLICFFIPCIYTMIKYLIALALILGLVYMMSNTKKSCETCVIDETYYGNPVKKPPNLPMRL
mgnify:FL=1